ncbi:MAG: NAD-dependent epimerase/dehydratase family protein [Methanomassiliicoccales archaeon]
MILENKKIVVTGAAGFIASHLTDRLLQMGNEVVGIDNLSAGREEFLRTANATGRFRLVRKDLLRDDYVDDMRGAEAVFHFAANPDVRQGPNNTRVHFDQNIEVTYKVLEAMRAANVKGICFPSTSTVYGEVDQIPTREDFGPLKPISIYGASKLASEALISSYCHTFGFSAAIYRFANVVGSRSTHNVLHDFIRKLNEDGNKLEILGAAPGTRKSYVHVSDCVEGMVVAASKVKEGVDIYNIGSEDWLDVQGIADIVTRQMHLEHVRYDWTGGVMGGRGWIGDVKLMLLSVERLKTLGWKPTLGSAAAIERAVKEILASKH